MEKRIEDFLDYMEQINPSAAYPIDFEDAIVGIAERIGSDPLILLDKEKCIEILMENMDREEAEEYFEFNILGSWVGEGTPVFLSKLEDMFF